MKLKHILFASLAVCCLASCSKDDDTPVVETPKTPVDASLSFMAFPENTKTELRTKAENPDPEPGVGKENKVTRLTVYIFSVPTPGAADAEKKFVTSQSTGDGTTEVTKIEHVVVKVTPNDLTGKSDDKFEAVFVANAGPLSVSTLADLKEKDLNMTLDNLKDTIIPMISKTISISGLTPLKDANGNAKNENWVGNGNNVTVVDHTANSTPTGYAPIELTRLVARVQLESLKVDFTKKYGKNAEFTFNTLSLVNVRSRTSMTVGLPPYVKGYESPGYKKAQEWIKPEMTCVPYLKKGDYNVKMDSDDATTTVLNAYSFTNNDKFSRYIFTNPEKKSDPEIFETALLISGIFRTNKTDDSDKGEERHYRVYLKPDAGQTGAGVVQVLPNMIYKLYVTLDGEGSPNEDDILTTASVTVKVICGPWKTIDQEEDITGQ